MTNDLRIRRALAIIYQYALLENRSDVPLIDARSAVHDSAIVDLLADLRHLCALHDLDFDHCVKEARVNFVAEHTGEETVNG